jgi:hypothetical protein
MFNKKGVMPIDVAVESNPPADNVSSSAVRRLPCATATVQR